MTQTNPTPADLATWKATAGNAIDAGYAIVPVEPRELLRLIAALEAAQGELAKAREYIEHLEARLV